MKNNYEMKTDRKCFRDMDEDDCWINTMTNFGEITVEIVIDHDSGAFPMKDAATVREMGEHLIKMADYMENKNKQSWGKEMNFNRENKYNREIIGLDGTVTTVDCYRVIDAFKVADPATQHAIKKLLCLGLRGHKDYLTDLNDSIESLQKAKELYGQRMISESSKSIQAGK